MAPPQRKLFTPWPAGEAVALIERLIRGNSPKNNRLIVAGVDVGIKNGWKVVG